VTTDPQPGPQTSLPEVLRGPRLYLFVRLVFIGCGQAGASIAIVFLVRYAFDSMHSRSSLLPDEKFWWVMGGLATAAIVLGFLRILERIEAERLGQEYVARVRLCLFDRLAVLPTRVLQQRNRGSLMLRFVTDLNGIRQWVSRGLVRLVVACIASVGVLAALAFISPILGLVVLAFFAIAIGVTISLGRPLQTRTREVRRKRSFISANVEELLSAFAVVQLFGQERRERRHLAKQSSRLVQAAIARERLEAFARVLPEVAVSMAIVAILLITAYEVRGGRASLGGAAAAIAILHFLSSLVRDLARSFVYWNNYQVARQKLEQLLRNPSFLAESPSASDLDSITGQLIFEQVSVTRSLVEVTASVEPGQVVAITGPTGAGKSTLLSLAARLLDPDRGRVLLDGHDLRSLTLPSIRAAVGMVSPSLPLLRGSIKRNILYRMQNASPDDYAYIRAYCELDEELDRLPDGDLTEVAEGGVNLPTGLRQRISLARALLGDPVLILMDEPDAGLDPAGRAIIERILSQRRATVLFVTNDQSRIRMADVVWYFEKGLLVEQGTPETLLSKDGPLAHSFGLVPSAKANL